MQCPRCRLENPETAIRCDCGWDFQSNTIQPSYFQSFADIDPASGRELASLSDRFLGQLIDSLIVLGLIIVVVIFSTALPESAGAAAFVVALIVGILYLLLSDGLKGGQSYGKKVMKTAVIHADSGQPCTFGRSFVRNITLQVLGILDWLFIFGSKRQRLGDMLVNTIVVKLRKY